MVKKNVVIIIQSCMRKRVYENTQTIHTWLNVDFGNTLLVNLLPVPEAGTSEQIKDINSMNTITADKGRIIVLVEYQRD